MNVVRCTSTTLKIKGPNYNERMYQYLYAVKNDVTVEAVETVQNANSYTEIKVRIGYFGHTDAGYTLFRVFIGLGYFVITLHFSQFC